jgi:hypothetical protein
MLALQLVIGIGIALLFPMLIATGVAIIKAPPKSSRRINLRAEASEETTQANREQIAREQEALRLARVEYAKIMFTVMVPAGLAALLAGYLIGVNAIGIGFLTGGILCTFSGYAGYWMELPPVTRFVSLLAGLLMLLFIGISYLGVI